jgi:hypothetical protein
MPDTMPAVPAPGEEILNRFAEVLKERDLTVKL